MPKIRDDLATPTTEQSWSRLQHAVHNELPRRLRNTARSIEMIRQLRRRYR